MRRSLVSALILFVVAVSSALGQELTCSQTLRLARSTYEQGRLHELPDLVARCLNNGFTEVERAEAFKLETLAYIYLEEPDSADMTMLRLLQTEPEFKVNNEIDPAEFVALYNTFRTEPVYRLGVKGGPNASQPNVHRYSPLNGGKESYSYGFGFQAGVTAEIPILREMFKLNPELYYQSKSFKVDNLFYEDAQHTTGTVATSWLTLPVSLQYEWKGRKGGPELGWIPYVGVGASFELILSVSSNLNTTIDFPPQSPVVTVNTNKSQYKTFNIAPIISGGVKRKVKKAELVAEIRYNFGVSTIFDQTQVYASQPEIFDSKFIHGPFSMNTLSVSFGYLLNKYVPKKKSTH